MMRRIIRLRLAPLRWTSIVSSASERACAWPRMGCGASCLFLASCGAGSGGALGKECPVLGMLCTDLTTGSRCGLFFDSHSLEFYGLYAEWFPYVPWVCLCESYWAAINGMNGISNGWSSARDWL